MMMTTMTLTDDKDDDHDVNTKTQAYWAALGTK
jgi:hypothetical protein